MQGEENSEAPGDPALPLLVEVARVERRRWAQELALVLAARGIEVQVGQLATPAGPRFTLIVDESDGPVAARELRLYSEEHRREPRPPGPRLDHPDAWRGSLVYGLLIAAGFAFQRSGLGEWERGLSDAAAIVGGEVWLALTALLLHADPLHLVSNLFFGGLLGALVALELGSARAWLGILLAGWLGNLMNAGFYVGYRGEEHFSLGASTAVFGAVGLLAMLGFASKAHESWARRALPLVMGVVMLGLYGASGENTDIMAHVLGFLGGVLVFGLGALWMRRWDLPGPLASAYWTLGLVAAAAALTWLPQGP